ncbi:NADH dehydrogenase ubiquinone Fe-S protein 4 [Brevundimonas diminuta]|uniref:NADH dehydrogenase ubiquinone Fe-S protein 4 n=1 Tax=Brevundimonas diminuta TaxID=293 RepID=UPI00338F3E25
MTSAPRPNYWVLEFEPSRPPQIEPLMGYTSSGDPYRPIRLKFPDRDSAVDFAERQDWHYVVREDAGGARMANPWRVRRATGCTGASMPREPSGSPSAPIAASQEASSMRARPTRLPATGRVSIRSSKPRSNPSPPLILRRGR